MSLLSRLADAFARRRAAAPAPATPPASFSPAARAIAASAGRSTIAKAFAAGSKPLVGDPVTRRMSFYSPAFQSNFSPWGPSGANTVDALFEQMYGPFARAREPDPVIKLMLGDPDIALGRYVWRSRFYAVEWRVTGGSPEHRAHVWAALKPFLHQWIESGLWSLDFGRQAVELTWTREDLTFEWAEGAGKPRKRTMRGAYVPREPRDLDPEQTAILVDDRGDYAGVRYQGANAPIPAERTVLFVNEPLWGDLLGIQFTARGKRAWEDCNFARLWLNRYLESKGDPPLVGTAPGLEETDEAGNVANPIRIMSVAAKNLRSGGSIILPFEVQEGTQLPMYTLKALEVAQRAEEFIPWLGDLRAEKRLAWCLPGGVASSPKEGGSFSKAQVDFGMIDPFFDVVKKRVVLDTINRHIIPKILEANYGQMPRSEMCELEGGDLSSNMKAYSLELLKNGYAGTTILPDGRKVLTAHLADIPKVLKTLNVPMVDPALIPEAPDEIDLGDGGLRPGPGQPKRITKETDRPASPSRPGLSRAFALPAPDAWLSGALSGLAAIDDVVFRAERLAESERASVEAEIRNLAKKAIARARTGDGAVLASNRTLARELERDVHELLEQSLHQDLLDDQDVDADTLGFAGRRRSPLAAAHGQAFRAASETLKAAGVSAPGKAAGLRIVRDVVRDANKNGTGVVVRETRRISENVDRLVIGETPQATAEAVVDAYALPERDFIASTVHHVRATARATLAWPGAQAEAEAYLVTAGPASEAEVLGRFPAGQVAEQLWTIRTGAELDEAYHALVVDEGRPVTSWRNLGLNFGSQEMYVPIPWGLLGAIAVVVNEKRREWNRKRLERQAEIDALKRGEAPTPLARMGAGRPPEEDGDVTKEELRSELALFRAGLLGEVAKFARSREMSAPPAPPPAPPSPAVPFQLHFPGASVVMPPGSAMNVTTPGISVDGVGPAAAQIAGALERIGTAAAQGGAEVAKAIGAIPATVVQPSVANVTVTPEVTAKLQLPPPRERTAKWTDADGEHEITITGGK